MSISDTTVTDELQELIRRSEELRKVFAQTSAQVDAEGEDPGENLRQIAEAGIYRIHIPQAYGGLSNGTFPFGFGAVAETITQLSAGEGSTGMIYTVQTVVLRELFASHADLPESTLRQLAHEVLEEDARFVASNAETGTSGRVIARKVPGGIVVNGTKTFNTGSGGARYASVGLILEGVEGMHHALVPLNAPGVKLHHDWDNMGQRATVSQSITYEDVFVPDGWHYHRADLDPLLIPAVFLLHGALELGIGMGGFDAMLDYVRTVNRTILPGVRGAAEDPLMRLHVGEFSTKLAAAHALQREVAHLVETFEAGQDISGLLAHAMRSKVASVDAALTTTGGMHELTGARSTSNTYRLDRFWRNARTFSVHDATDLKLLMVGTYELTGTIPALNPYQVRI
ncbi:MAG TPA: acyl-CoA dehydrogenase family protein [Ktedonobacteraceae bacterium]|jgi:alkylation response protein AidB-like acyl-CoA dehydrogenase|nr:acyl-CoA dehydrogenase family protein [Ktedonobacteraceae bacterium]